MKISRLDISDILVLEPRVFSDERGFFFESFNREHFDDAVGRQVNFVQDNHSFSRKGVLRGLHYQVGRPQGKLVRVVEGEVFDVAVDLRRSSPTFGKWVGQTLSAENKLQLWIPGGFAHGFLVKSEVAQFLYKTTDFYAPDSERSIIWNDPTINITWPLSSPPILSKKDMAATTFAEAQLFR